MALYITQSQFLILFLNQLIILIFINRNNHSDSRDFMNVKVTDVGDCLET